MRISLRFFLPLITVLLFFITALFLLAGSTYFFYTTAVGQLVDDKVAFLQLVRESIYNPLFYYRSAQYPTMRYIIFEEAAKNPGIAFLRVAQPGTNKIIWTSVGQEELGNSLTDVPYFSNEVGMRDGQWQGQPVKEIFISGAATEGLWIAVNLNPIRDSALSIAIKQGLIILVILVAIYSVFYFILRKMILNPLEVIHNAISQVRKGDLDAKIETRSKTEIGELAVTFNEMIKDLKKSHSALEESKKILETKVAERTKELQDLTDNLDEQVKNKTEELRDRIKELEQFQKVTVGRELKMVDLKEEIKKLKEGLGKK